MGATVVAVAAKGQLLSIRLYRNDDSQFNNATQGLGVPDEYAQTYAFAWGDYNLDSYLDMYVCNWNFDDGVTNWLFKNNGDGTFTEMAAELGVDNGSLNSMGVVWIDINFDGWPDIYMINERDQSNELWINDGGTGFIEVTEAWNAGAYIHSMTNSITDFDLDGDFDVYLTNDNASNVFLKNEGDHFVDVAEEAGLLLDITSWGASWLDYDNNGFEDIYITTTPNPGIELQNYFFRSNGDGTFTENNDVGFADDDYPAYSCAKGDMNNDGFYDLLVSRTDDVGLFQNLAIGGNWIKFDLQGTVSNRDAIGTLIEVYANENRYIRYTMCGENYMSQDSQYEIFGIGEAMQVDSVILNWPSGLVEKYMLPSINTFHHYIEGEALAAQITADGPLGICGADGSLVLTASAGVNYQWNTGATTQSITVTEPGTYSVELIHELGFVLNDTIEVSMFEMPEYFATITNPLCAGETTGHVELLWQGEEPVEVEWETGTNGNTINNLEGGIYEFSFLTIDGCEGSGSAQVTVPDAIIVSWAIENATCFESQDGTATHSVSGGTGEISIDWQGADAQALSLGEYVVILSDENGCTLLDTITIDAPDELVGLSLPQHTCFGESGSAEIEITGGTWPYTEDWNGAEPNSLAPGTYNVQVTDAVGCTTSVEVEILEYSEITIDGDVTNANEGSNGAIEIVINGGTEPYDIVWSTGEDENTITNVAQGIYSVTVIDVNGCAASNTFVVIDVAIEEPYLNEIVVTPNPVEQHLTIQIPNGAVLNGLVALDTKSKVVKADSSVTTGNRLLNCNDLQPGVYVLGLQVGRQWRFIRVVKV